MKLGVSGTRINVKLHVALVASRPGYGRTIGENRHLLSAVFGHHDSAFAEKKAGKAHRLFEQPLPIARQVQHDPIDMPPPGLREKPFHIFIAGLFFLLVAVEGRKIDHRRNGTAQRSLSVSRRRS